MIKSIYLIGSLRNEKIPQIGNALRGIGLDVFDDWYAAGPEADDYWKKYEQGRGRSYEEALEGYAVKNVFNFDKTHLDRVDAGLLVLPAGRSGHLELGYITGLGKPSFILNTAAPKLDDGWEWLAGLYEGEGSITINNTKTKKNLQLSVSTTDKDVVEKLKKIAKVGHEQGPYFRKHANLIKQPKVIKPAYRWAVYKKEDILHVCRGMFDNLCSRRRGQIVTILAKMGWIEDFEKAEGPFEERYDAMYRFATKVFFDEEKMMDYFA